MAEPSSPGQVGTADATAPRRIVFVCTGNTCRSPMAEAICKKLLADRLGCTVEQLTARGWVVESAGLGAMPGMPAASEAIDIARLHGADLAAHRSQILTEEMAHHADYLLGMTQAHVQAMQQALPAHPTGARLLSAGGVDVEDPIGRPLEAYEACARQMRRYIEELIATLPS